MDNPLRIFYAVFAAMLCIISLLFSIRFPKYHTAFIVGAWLFVIILVIVLIMLGADSYKSVIDSMTDFVAEYKTLDYEGRAALGIVFPFMSVQLKKGVPRLHFEKTNVPIDDNQFIQKFLMDSNKDYIAPRRNWQTKDDPNNPENRPAWVWDEIVAWGIEHKKIQEQSYAGNHSWRWIGNSYMQMMAYWNPGRNTLDLSEMETA